MVSLSLINDVVVALRGLSTTDEFHCYRTVLYDTRFTSCRRSYSIFSRISCRIFLTTVADFIALLMTNLALKLQLMYLVA